MAAVVQIVQLLAEVGACAVALMQLELLSRNVGLFQSHKADCAAQPLRKPCPRCQASVPVPRRPALGLKVQCLNCDAHLACTPKRGR